ncbi:MAG: hypothetical protein ABR861_09615 [Terriglobales bacterium]
MDFSAEAQPDGTPSGTDGDPLQELPAAGASAVPGGVVLESGKTAA